MRLEEAQNIAHELADELKDCTHRIVIAGSIRRRKSWVGDIELLVIPKGRLLDLKLQELIAKGKLAIRGGFGPQNKFLTHLPSGINVDIFATDEERWPAALVVRTGPAESNIKIAMAAKKKGWRFHAYGDGFTDKRGKKIVCHSERDVFELVGLPYKEPWDRE